MAMTIVKQEVQFDNEIWKYASNSSKNLVLSKYLHCLTSLFLGLLAKQSD